MQQWENDAQSAFYYMIVSDKGKLWIDSAKIQALLLLKRESGSVTSWSDENLLTLPLSVPSSTSISSNLLLSLTSSLSASNNSCSFEASRAARARSSSALGPFSANARDVTCRSSSASWVALFNVEFRVALSLLTSSSSLWVCCKVWWSFKIVCSRLAASASLVALALDKLRKISCESCGRSEGTKAC